MATDDYCRCRVCTHTLGLTPGFFSLNFFGITRHLKVLFTQYGLIPYILSGDISIGIFKTGTYNHYIISQFSLSIIS